MSNILQRLLLFIFGVPGFIALVVFLPHYKHAGLVALVLAVAAGSGRELGGLVKAKGLPARPALYAFLALLPPAFAYASAFFPGRGFSGLVALGSGLVLVIVFSSFALARKESLPQALPSALGLGFSLLYPGLLSSFIVLIAVEPLFATEAILGFALMTFGNDSLAWLFGISLGRRRNIFAVSPNKSLAGFFGGLGGSVAAILLCRFLFEEAFSAPTWALLIMALLVGMAAILGDLFESALKRSAGVKDSGEAVPGRGGFLDSFDSLLFAAPVYYGLSLLLGLFK